MRPLRAGCPAEGGRQDCVNPFKAFQGCMRLLTVHNQPVDPIPLQQRLMGNYSHLQIDMCGILDRSDFLYFLPNCVIKYQKRGSREDYWTPRIGYRGKYQQQSPRMSPL